ncbi:MAG: preprotein translocase subunit SecE [Clostridia bacterium]
MAEVEKTVETVVLDKTKPENVKVASDDKAKLAEKTKKTKAEKKTSKIKTMLKETGSELKKVTWPSFGKVVKQTGVVLAVVIFFMIILFAFDRLLAFLFGLIIPSA